MKKLVLVILIALAAGAAVFLVFNALGFRPLDSYGNDPNSNAMIVAIAYFLIAGALFGMSRNQDRTAIGREEYAKEGLRREIEDSNRKFPYALAFAVLGVLSIALYLGLNRLIAA